MRSRGLRRLAAGAGALAAVLVGQLVVVDAAEAGPDTNAPGTAALAGEIQGKFEAYGNSTSVGRWTGGDGLEAIELPDGRVLWFFNDYFHGTVNADQTRDPFQASMPRNGIVIQNANGTMGQTVIGNLQGPNADKTLMRPYSGWLWGGDQRLEGNTVQKFYMHMQPGGWGTSVGVELRTIPTGSVADANTHGNLTSQLPPDVAECSAQPWPGHCVLWGMAMADHGGFTYIYGADIAPGSKKLRIARVDQGDLTGTWKYWTGTGWSFSQADAIDTGTTASEALSVTYQQGRWVLVTQDTVGELGGDVISYYADTPYGFTGADKSTLFGMPETTAEWGIWSYTPRVLPHLSSGGNQVIIGYSFNSQYKDGSCGQHEYIDASIYRPRFRSVSLPDAATGTSPVPANGPSPGSRWLLPDDRPAWCKTDPALPPAQLPPSPSGVTATAAGGNTSLQYSWTQPSYVNAGWSYGFQFRAAGDEWGTEWPMFAPDSRTWTAGYLSPGRTYEFRVRAVTWEGTNSPWTTKTVTMPINAPTGLSVTRTASNKCSLTITDPQGGVYWHVQQRKLDTTAWGAATAVATKTPWFGVTAGVKYEYRVRAYNSYANGPWSVVKKCGL